MRWRPATPIAMGAEKRNGPETEFETKEADAARVATVTAALRSVPAPRRTGDGRAEDERACTRQERWPLFAAAAVVAVALLLRRARRG
eukprot:739217-Prymnesium_polylepis.2